LREPTGSYLSETIGLSLAQINQQVEAEGPLANDLSHLIELYSQFKIKSYTQIYIPAIRHQVGYNGLVDIGNDTGIGQNLTAPINSDLVFAKPMLPQQDAAYALGQILEMPKVFRKSRYSRFSVNVPLRTAMLNTYTDQSTSGPDQNIVQRRAARTQWLDILDDGGGLSSVQHGWLVRYVPPYGNGNNVGYPLGSNFLYSTQNWTIRNRVVVMFKDNQ